MCGPVEVFANDRQAVATALEYKPANTSIRLLSDGGDLEVAEATAWTMRSIYTER